MEAHQVAAGGTDSPGTLPLGLLTMKALIVACVHPKGKLQVSRSSA
jgi:hypothetical protein